MDGLLVTLVTLAIMVLFVLGVPIILIIGLWTAGISLVIDFTLSNIGVTLFEGVNFYGLLALPLFILTGDFINASGIAKKLTDFAYSALGWLRGSLAMATIGACGLFAAISGSNSATTAAIGSIMYPELKKGGYNENFAAATSAAGGTVGIIIPPSIVFIIYGFLMHLSISDLFIGGLLPGLLMVVAMMVACWGICAYKKWGQLIAFDIRRIARDTVGAYLGFIAIFIILFGIYSGTFSPTEAAGITAGYCLFSGLFITRQLKWKNLPAVIMRSGQITGLLAPLIAISIVMQQVLSLLGARDFVSEMIGGLGGYYPVLFACMFFVLAAGTFLESVPNTIILAPILAPIAAGIGVDPIHFAVIFLVGDAIGFITPPYGLNLYVASGITGIPYFRLLKFVVPYLLALLIAWVFIALIPELSTYLVELGVQGAGVKGTGGGEAGSFGQQ